MVPSLPDPPIVERFLFEQPLAPVAVLVVAAVAVLVVANQRAKLKAGALVGAVLLLGAVGVWLTARLVTTEREEIKARAVQLVDAAGRIDIEAVRPILHESVRLVGWRDREGRDRILNEIDNSVRGIAGVTSARVVESQAVIDGPGVGRTHVRVHVESTQPMPPKSWWRIDWAREGGGWVAVRIEWLDPWR